MAFKISIDIFGKRKLFFSFAFSFLLMFSSLCQDIHFSQFYMTPLLLNPAQAGAQHDMRGTVNYKSQWSSVAQPYSTANLSWDMRIGKTAKSGIQGVGINISQDKAGNPQIK